MPPWLTRSSALVALAMLALARAIGAQPPPPAHKVNPAAVAAVLVHAPPRTIPNVLGWHIDSAWKAVQARDVGVIRRDVTTPGMAQDHVARQSPPAGTPVIGNMAETLYVAIAPPAAATPGRGRGGAAPKKPGGDAPPPGTSDGPPAKRKVPNLSGLPLAGARTLLAQNNLRLTETSAESTEVVSPGLVFQQNPKAGTPVDAGTGVAVWYSLGPHRAPPPILMPNVVGRTVGQAVELLRKPQLRLIKVDSVRASGGKGIVDHQQPEAGTPVHPGEPVSLHVTLAPVLLIVPSVVGMYTARARAVLEKSGFQLGSVTHVARGRADSTVFEQTPGPGASAERGSPVDVEENTLIPPRKTVVPNLSGLTLDSASQLLSTDSLRVGRIGYRDEGGDPRVMLQNPRAGAAAVVNQFVDVTLETQHQPSPPPPPAVPDTVQVPNVTGISFEEARRDLQAAGLVAVGTAAADTIRDPRVVAQSRKPGSFVPVQSGIELTLIGRERPPVPDVVGSTQHAAEDHLGFDGYAMRVDTTRRVLLSLFTRVAAQRPTVGARPPQDSVGVDLTTPLIPPIPASVTIVLVGAVAVGKRVWDPHKHWRPISDLDFDFNTAAPSPPVLHAATPENLAKAVVSFEVDTPTATWRVTPDDISLVP